MLKMPEMTTDEFYDRLDELTVYYDSHDDIPGGVFLKNKKYWYLWYGAIQYGFVDYDTVGAIRDGSCKNRIHFIDSTVHMKIGGSIRTVDKLTVTDDRKMILKYYAKYLKAIGSGQRQLDRLGKTYPELVL